MGTPRTCLCVARSREGAHERAEIRAQPAIRDFRLRLTCSGGTRHTSSLHPSLHLPLTRLHWALLQCGGWQGFCRNLPGGFQCSEVFVWRETFSRFCWVHGLHSVRFGFRPLCDWFGQSVTADPNVTRPSTTPCVVQLFSGAQFYDFNVENSATLRPPTSRPLGQGGARSRHQPERRHSIRPHC